MTYPKIISFIFCIIWALTSVLGQTEKEHPDTLGHRYFKKTLLATDAFELELARSLADSALMYFESSEDQTQKAKYNFLLGLIHWKRGAYEASKEKLEEYLPIARQNQDSAMMGVTLYHLSLAKENLGDIEAALKDQLESITLYEGLKDQDELFNGMNHMGQIHRKLNQFEQSEIYFQEALDIAVKTNNRDRQAIIYLNMGNLQGQQGHFDSAINYYRQAEIIDSVDGDIEGLSFISENYGNLYGRSGKIEEAQEYFLKALKLRKQLQGSLEIGRIYQKIGSVYNMMGKHQEALSSMDSAMYYNRLSGAVEVQKNIALARALVYNKIGDYKNAYDQMQIHKELQDSFLNKSITDRVTTLNAAFDSERKEQEIELLNAEKEIAAAKLRSTRIQMALSITGLVLFAILTAFIYRLWQRTKIQNEIIEKSLMEKEILIREIHHRVKNNLQFISSLLGLQSEHVSDHTALDALQEGQDRVQSMALIHQNLYQEENLTGVEVRAYFIKLIRNLFDSYNIRRDQVDLDLDIATLNLDVDTVIPIGLIVNELISNSLKYAFNNDQKGLISVTLKEINNSLLLQVSDNGKGIHKDELAMLGSSFGYRLIHVLKDQLQASLNIKNEKGTSVEMYIRKYAYAA